MYTGEMLWPKNLTEDMVDWQCSDGEMIRTYPDLPQNMYTAMIHTTNRLPDKTAIVDDEGRSYSYQNLYRDVKVCSYWLHQNMQIRKGQHVALLLYNSIEFCVSCLALNRLGAVVVPLPTKYKKEEILSLVKKSDVSLILCDEKFITYFDHSPKEDLRVYKVTILNDPGRYQDLCEKSDNLTWKEEADASAPALLMFTSGTTSQSKGVVLKNYQVMHAIVSYQRTLGIEEEERAILPVPIYLITGLVAVFGLMIYTGGTVYLHRFFDAGRVLEDIKRYQITFLHASPTVFTLLLEKRTAYKDLPSLRMFACGSSNMPPGKIQMLHKWLPHCEFRTVYGLTETTSPGTVFPMDANQSAYLGASGIPIPGVTIQIVDDSGREVEAETKGEIWIKGSNVASAYYPLTASASYDGWLKTGDIGYMNKDGYLYVVDRKKDMINRGGEKICSFDVENELLSIYGVEDTAVVGIADELYGEVPVAVVKLQEGSSLTETELKAILKERMANYKVPVKISIVDKIPTTENLKTDKKAIRAWFQ